MPGRAKADDASHVQRHATLKTVALRTRLLTLRVGLLFATANSTLRDYYLLSEFSLRCQILLCDDKSKIAPLRFAPPGDSFGFNLAQVVAPSGATNTPLLIQQTAYERSQEMTIDEKVALRLERSGIDIETDEGARLYQEHLEREIERQRKRNWHQPPPPVLRMNGIRI